MRGDERAIGQPARSPSKPTLAAVWGGWSCSPPLIPLSFQVEQVAAD